MTLIEEQFGSVRDGSFLTEDEDSSPIADFEQDGKLLKIAVKGLTVQDYVKRLQESDILVAIDGKVYRDGPLKLRELFEAPMESVQSGWLLTFWRDGAILICSSAVQLKADLDLRLCKRLNGRWKSLKNTPMQTSPHTRITRCIGQLRMSAMSFLWIGIL